MNNVNVRLKNYKKINKAFFSQCWLRDRGGGGREDNSNQTPSEGVSGWWMDGCETCQEQLISRDHSRKVIRTYRHDKSVLLWNKNVKPGVGFQNHTASKIIINEEAKPSYTNKQGFGLEG